MIICSAYSTLVFPFPDLKINSASTLDFSHFRKQIIWFFYDSASLWNIILYIGGLNWLSDLRLRFFLIFHCLRPSSSNFWHSALKHAYLSLRSHNTASWKKHKYIYKISKAESDGFSWKLKILSYELSLD